jgi:predicted nucleic acid-binding protein
MAADPVFLDTNILVAASVAEHPSHAAVSALLDKLTAEQAPLCISPQVCREFLVVLTRRPVEGRAFTVEEALTALDSWRAACVALPDHPLLPHAVAGLLEVAGREGFRDGDLTRLPSSLAAPGDAAAARAAG